MNKYVILALAAVAMTAGIVLYVIMSTQENERTVLYWTDPMVPGDRSDHPGKSPMGMERVPIYEELSPISDDEATGGSNYICPMHPSVQSDRPGACPVCGMALVKKTKMQDASEEEMKNLQQVSLSASQRVIANVSTTPVTRQDINKEISAVGVVDFAEPLFQHISMRFPGRLEKLYLTYTGQSVKKGDAVADVYSPDLVSAQREYLLALESYDETKEVNDFASMNARLMIDQSKQKLSLWGFSDNQLSELEQTKKVNTIVTIYSPISGTVLKKNVDPQHYAEMGEDIYDVADLSKVWIYLEVYEKDIRFILMNHPVHITTEVYPNETFKGKVTFIDPVLNSETRTVRVRTEFENPNGKLKPQMYVKAQIHVPSSSALVVPATAVLFTGKRNVVWIEMKPNVFEPRAVTLGISSGSFIEVLSGLEADDIVVTSGGYLLESESQLQQPGGASNEHQDHQIQKEARIIVDGNYSPNIIHAKRGEKLTIAFERHDESKCTDEVLFKDFGVKKYLQSHETTLIEITPKKSGEFKFSCGMEMIHGKLIVHE